jgi:hypothetical protein
VLARVWVEHELGANAAKKRRWELTIDAGDRNVQRDNQRDPREGRSVINSLWAAWESGAAVSLEDIDADTAWTPAALGSKWRLGLKGDAIEEGAEGAGLARWDDVSGAGNHATQGTAAHRPLYRANRLNGLPGVEYVSLDRLSCALPGDSLDETIVAVMRPNSLTTHNAIVGPSGNGGRVLRNEPTTGKLQLGGAGAFIIATTAALAHTVNTPAIVSSTLGATTWELGLNGAVETGAHAAAFTPGVSSEIGNQAGGGVGSVHDLYEVLVFQPKLTTAERQKVEGYLAHKWGLASSLPGGHPYKTSKPQASYTVTIAEIAERANNPRESNRRGESEIELVLLEV